MVRFPPVGFWQQLENVELALPRMQRQVFHGHANVSERLNRRIRQMFACLWLPLVAANRCELR